MSYQSNIPKINEVIKLNEKRALESIGIFVTGETKVRTPVDTGRLRDSYDHQVNEGVKRVRIGTNVEYAIFVEKGTRKMRAQPHLTPALEENKNKIEALASRELGRGLK